MARTASLDPLKALVEVLTPEGIQASNDSAFRGAIFGRDSMRVGLDLVAWFPTVAELAIFSLARLQATGGDDQSEAQVGKIPHEYRPLFVGGVKIDVDQRRQLRRVVRRRGLHPGGDFLYYGSVDATPQFIRLVREYCRLYGPGLLNREFRHLSGTVTTVGRSVLAAIGWVLARIDESDIDLVEFRRSNPKGIRYQAWRDGGISYRRHFPETGSIELANASAPIASLEVQGLAYDALVGAAELFEGDRPSAAKRWRRAAAALQRTTLEKFWRPEARDFAMAIDRDREGRARPVDTRTSTPAELLETGIFDTLPEEQRRMYVSAIVREMYSEKFLTEVGVRCMSTEYDGFLPYWDYHGPCTVWFMPNHAFALGLRRQGFAELADDVEARIWNGVKRAGAPVEFLYVEPEGHVHYNAQAAGPGQEDSVFVTNMPERIQAWTVSAVLAIQYREERSVNEEPPDGWQRELEVDILSNVSKTERPSQGEEAITESPVHRPLYLDVVKGRRLHRSLLTRLSKAAEVSI